MSQAVQAIADSPSIESLTLELSHADKLPLLSKLTNLKYLSIMTDYSKDLYKCGPTSAVLDLLENSSNMTQLEVSRLHLNPGRLYKLLKRNTTLESIKIHDCRQARMLCRAIGTALCDSNNVILCGAEIRDERGQWVQV